MHPYKTETNNNDYSTLQQSNGPVQKWNENNEDDSLPPRCEGQEVWHLPPLLVGFNGQRGCPPCPAGGGVWAWCAVKQGKIRQIFGRIFQQAVLSDMRTDIQQQSSCEETLSTLGQCCNPVSNFSSNLAICDMMGVVKNRCPILSLFCLRPPNIYIWSNWSIAPKWPQHHVELFQAKAETFPN